MLIQFAAISQQPAIIRDPPPLAPAPAHARRYPSCPDVNDLLVPS